VLLKSFLASTSNYNGNTNAKQLARMPHEKTRREFQFIIKMNQQGTWNQNVALWSHFSKMASNKLTLGNFWASLRIWDWFQCLSQKTFFLLLTCEETSRNQNVALWSHFSKMASNKLTLGNFWVSLRIWDWFQCLNQKTFFLLLTCEEMSSYNFSSSFLDQDSCCNEPILVGTIHG